MRNASMMPAVGMWARRCASLWNTRATLEAEPLMQPLSRFQASIGSIWPAIAWLAARLSEASIPSSRTFGGTATASLQRGAPSWDQCGFVRKMGCGRQQWRPVSQGVVPSGNVLTTSTRAQGQHQARVSSRREEMSWMVCTSCTHGATWRRVFLGHPYNYQEQISPQAVQAPLDASQVLLQ